MPEKPEKYFSPLRSDLGGSETAEINLSLDLLIFRLFNLLSFLIQLNFKAKQGQEVLGNLKAPIRDH